MKAAVYSRYGPPEPFARRVASEFCILDKGRSVAAGPIGELTDEVVRAHLSV